VAKKRINKKHINNNRQAKSIEIVENFGDFGILLLVTISIFKKDKGIILNNVSYHPNANTTRRK